MHPAAYEYVARFATDEPIRIVEFGARNVNGTARDHFPFADYWGVDAQEGSGVDEVHDGGDWLSEWEYDLVICTEVFEHTPDWRPIVANAFRVLRSGGRAVFTCAGPGRAPHGLHVDDPTHPGHYANVSVAELFEAMTTAGFVDVDVEQLDDDTRATGLRP